MTLFKSKLTPGAVMNRYRVVMVGNKILDKEERGCVIREAIEAGWTIGYCDDPDVGIVIEPPNLPHEQSGAENVDMSEPKDRTERQPPTGNTL